MDAVVGGSPAGTDRRSLGIADRLIAAIRRLPYGGWWLYVLVGAAVMAWVTAARWLTGAAPAGHVDVAALAPVPYGIFALALVQHLDDVSVQALRSFGPAIGDAERLAFWRSELTNLPARSANIAALLGLLFGLVVLAGTPPAVYLVYARDLPTTALVAGWTVPLGFAALAVLMYHTWRQLRVVSAIHAAATRIDPFQPEPVFAFSRLTARTGFGYLFILYYTVTINGELSSSENVILVADILIGVAAIACFVLPLLGIHRRLGEAKSDVLVQTDAGIASVRAELHRRIDRAEFGGMSEIDDAISSLARIRDLVGQLPTWPWTPGLFRGFLTAVLLPIVIWLITRLLGNTLTI